MNKTLKFLPALAMVLAAGLAFGFSPAQTSEHGYDGQNWIDVTGLTPGPDTYQCNTSTVVCTREAPNQSAPPVKSGIFVNNMD